MRRTIGIFTAPCIALALLGLVACGPSQEEQMATAQTEALTELESGQTALDGKREELAELQVELEGLDPEAEGAADRQAELEGEIGRRQGEIVGLSDDLVTAVVEFVNANPPDEGEPLSAGMLAAIRVKSSEEMLIAGEHIEKGGDYARAINIYKDNLKVDSDNPELLAALAEAEELRYMSRERFAVVEKGMTIGEVREELGQPLLSNMKDYRKAEPKREVTAWFYLTNENGSAAGVWFQPGKSGDEVVYKVDYEALVKEAPEG